MTAVLDELRRLEDAEARGTLRREEAKFRRTRLIAMVEDAEVIEDTAEEREERPPSMSATDQVWIFCALVIGDFVGITALVALAVRDVSIGITVGVTFLAVVIVQAVKGMKL